MGVKSFNNKMVSTKYVFNRKAGRSVIERRPIFSPDEEAIVVIVEDFVRVYNIQTGHCVRTLHTEGLVGELVAVEFATDNHYNLYGCSENGYVTTWTWEQGAVLREIKIQLSDDMNILSFKLMNSDECFIIAADSDNSLHLGAYSVKDGELLYEYTKLKPLYYGIISVALGWCRGDQFAAFTFGTQKLYIQNLYQPHLKTEIINHNKFRVMAVAAHQKDSVLAITDAIGRVTIIRGYLYDYRAVAREVLHWHFLPPFAVCFSVNGNYLISGGMEKVLVKWSLGSLANKTNEKNFIPRLPGMVRFITASHSYIAVALSNNSIVIANAQLRVQSTILERGGRAREGRLLAAHRALSALLLPGHAGHLQLYSTANDTVLYNIDITETNSLPSERQNLLPLDTAVTCAAISADGSWLATSEYRNDGFMYPEEKLKFWAVQTKIASPFKLNTCVNLSHGGCNVVALAFNNKGEFCVSSGTDQKFRIWKRDSTSQQHKEKVLWNCLTACYYSSGIAHFMSNPDLNRFKANESADNSDLSYMTIIDKKNDILMRIMNFRTVDKESNIVQADDGQSINDEFAMGGVAISQDGSLIAAWFGSKLTLWDTYMCNLRTTLSHPALRPKGVNVQFGNIDAAHYLVCSTEKCVAVWSLLSLTVKWMVHINTTCLVSDPFSNKMAMITTTNDVYIFSPHSSKPILTKKNLINPKSGIFQQCVFVASGNDDVRLYIVRNDSEIYCLEPEKSEENLEVISQRNLPRSNFSALVAEQQLYDVRSGATAETTQINKDSIGNNAISQFISGAPHMVPPVSLLCSSFLQHLSGYEETEQPQEDDIMEVDSESSDDEEDKQTTYNSKTVQLWTANYDEVKEKKMKKILKEPLLDLHITSKLFSNVDNTKKSKKSIKK